MQNLFPVSVKFLSCYQKPWKLAKGFGILLPDCVEDLYILRFNGIFFWTTMTWV
jgi:hypothetical protein